MDGIRTPAVAGSFYPGDPEELRGMIKGYLKSAEESAASGSGSIPKTPKGKKKGILRGIVVPHAGYVYSGPVAAYAYNLLQGLDIPERIIIIGPSHYASFPGLAESGYASWSTPLGELEAFSIRENRNESGIAVYPPAHEPEHSLEVQLPFLQVALEGRRFKVDPLLTGEVSPGDGAKALEDAMKNSFLVVSSDLSHYMPYKDAVARDGQTLALLDSMDADRFMRSGDACGRSGIAIAIALAKKMGWYFQRLKYANSGDTAGPKSEVVGYAALAIIEG